MAEATFLGVYTSYDNILRVELWYISIRLAVYLYRISSLSSFDVIFYRHHNFKNCEISRAFLGRLAYLNRWTHCALCAMPLSPRQPAEKVVDRSGLGAYSSATKFSQKQKLFLCSSEQSNKYLELNYLLAVRHVLNGKGFCMKLKK